MMLRFAGCLALTIGLSAFAVACSDSATAASSVASLAVTGTPPAVGASSQLTATATLSSGSTQDVTSQATWSSSDTGVATVSNTGLVTGVASGAATIQATYQSISGSEPLAVP